MKKLLLLALLALAPALRATPTRLLTTDNLNQIVPDDWDATTYYSLSPNFKNHWYADSYPTGKSLGWGFLDIGIGTLVLWFNKPFEAGTLYDAASGLSPLGVTNTAFSANLVNAWEPREKRIQTPDNKIALGYALQVTDDLNLGFCFRLAQLDNTKDADSQDGNGAAGAPFGPSAGYQTTLGSAAYNGLNTVKYANTQAGNGLVCSPQFSYLGSSIDLDFKFDMVWAGVNNSHSESLVNGVDSGTITQTLKDQGRMSWYARPKLRYMLDNTSSIVVRVSYGQLDLSTLHHVTGSFSGAGFTPEEQAGYDLTDSDQEMAVTQWDSTLGLLKTWNKGKDLVLWGLVPSGQTVHLVATSYQTRGTATSFNDVVRNNVQDNTYTTWQIPIVMGTELSLSPWCKARSVVQRNLFADSDTKTRSDQYSNADVLVSRGLTSVTSDFNPGWVFNNGFGLSFGQFSWDTALNLSFLASANNAAFVNPLYQSSFTYEF
jgi:hypothetical protein